MKVYVLLCGDYGEEGVWPVGVFTSKEAAETAGHKYDYDSPWLVEEFTMEMPGMIFERPRKR